MRRGLPTIVVLSALTVVDAAQAPTPASSELRFDVASVKRSPPVLDRALQPFAGIPQPGVWRIRDQPLIAVLRNIYPGRPLSVQIVGAPEWSEGVRDLYDIEARTTPTASADDIRQMARALLADRFKLAVHTEQRQVPAFVLVKRGDGKFGSGLKTPSVDCTAFRAGGARPTDPARQANADRLACAVVLMPTFDHTRLVPGTDMRISGGDVPVSRILTLLANELKRPVIDGTGLADQRFDIELQFTSDPLRTTGDSGPAIRTAITEQLGLQVQETRTMIDVLVIDHVERPTEN
jgi:uncharacterized protein (TIGR03435 family)